MSDDAPLPLSVIEFTANNPHTVISQDGGSLIVSKPWGTEDVELTIPLTETANIEDLRFIMLNPQMDALLHLDSNEAEFIFAFVVPSDDRSASYFNRSFKFHFEGAEFECGFREPTKRLYMLAARYRRLPSEVREVVVPQLVAFRDYQRRAELPAAQQRFFDERVARSFFVKPSIPLKETDWEILSRHLNLLMTYYDRSTPRIIHREKADVGPSPVVERLRFIEGRFPSELSFRSSDEILLRLLEVARFSSPRSSFIYYFQVFEYAGFHFVDAKSKTLLVRLLRSPSFISCAEERIGDLLAILTDVAQSDDVRIRRVVEEYCDPKALWREVANDRDFFTNDITFDGGFVLPKLIAKDTTEESWCAMWTPKLIDQVTRIRNCLVHAREKRESKVIMPTGANELKIERFLPLARRMAEQIVIHGDTV